MLFFLNVDGNGNIFPTLRLNNSCKTYNFRIKVGNVQIVLFSVFFRMKVVFNYFESVYRKTQIPKEKYIRCVKFFLTFFSFICKYNVVSSYFELIKKIKFLKKQKERNANISYMTLFVVFAVNKLSYVNTMWF
jgi:hypothetical protein